MTANTVTMRGRAAVERLMVDSCTITRQTIASTDPETGQITYNTTAVYSGKCRVQQKAPAARPHQLGEASVWLQRLELQLPMSVTQVASDDLVAITSSTLDADLVGRTWRVRELSHKTHETARRHQIEEVTG